MCTAHFRSDNAQVSLHGYTENPICTQYFAFILGTSTFLTSRSVSWE
jgi:hypothetical protein